MKKTLIITALVVLFFLLAVGYFWKYTQSFSPEETVDYNKDGLHLQVVYCRPFKKGRIIFGGLEPYHVVWRTGANRATTFETDSDLRFMKGDSSLGLKAGKYSLWTIPGPKAWVVIFNSEVGQWGINFNGSANRDSKNDVIKIEVPVVTVENVVQQFTIDLKKVAEEMEMTLQWDKTLVRVTFSK
jgi:hypothetical protein